MQVRIELKDHEVLKICNLLANRAEYMLRIEKNVGAGYYLGLHEKLLNALKEEKLTASTPSG